MRKSQRLKFLMTGAVIVAISWLGYWMTYITNKKPMTEELANFQNSIVHAKFKNLDPDHDGIQKVQVNGVVHQDIIPDSDRAKGIVGNKDNVYVVDNTGKKSSNTKNKVNEIDPKQHALGIHAGHAGKISQSINNQKDKNKEDDKSGKADKPGKVDKPVKADKVKLEERMKESEIFNMMKGGGKEKLVANTSTNHKKSDNDSDKTKDSSLTADNKSPKKETNNAYQPEPPKKRKPLPVFKPNEDFYALMHGDSSQKVHGKIHAHIKVMEDHVDPKTYIFSSKSLPTKERWRPSVGNGVLGTLVHSKEVFMMGVYNGRYGDSHRAVIPSTCSMNVTETEPKSNFTREHKLNVGEGIYSEVSSSKNYTLTQRIYAHRNFTQLLVVEIDLVRHELKTPLKLKVKLNKWTTSYDFSFTTREFDDSEEVSYKFGRILAPEIPKANYTEVHILYDHVPDELVPAVNATRTKWVFLTSIGLTKKEAFDAYKKGKQLIFENDKLYAMHVQAWSDLWKKGRIDIGGNLKLSKAIYGSMYYILSSMPLQENPEWPFVGLTPSGLPLGSLGKDYQGHVFWDQETWMYPPILLFYPDLGKLILNTRKRTIAGAKINCPQAMCLKYAWESAVTGIDVCPNKIYSDTEIHVNGDITYSILQYLYATNNTDIIEKEKFAEIVSGIASFWVTRLKHNDTLGKYEILNVTGPDEDNKFVNNSVYTNNIAQMSLAAPQYLFKLLNKTVDKWKHFADNIYLPFDKKKNYHPEFDGYKEGTRIKQADAILLKYPMERNMSREVHRADMSAYEHVVSPSGPAMSWSMYAIGWLREKEFSKADAFFQKNYGYIKNEFQVWSETTTDLDQAAANFITGMGGFLQAIIFGYGGFSLRPDRLILDPVIPTETEEMHFTGIDYLGSTINFYFHQKDVRISLAAKSDTAPLLMVYLFNPEQIYNLDLGKSVSFERRQAIIMNKALGMPDGP